MALPPNAPGWNTQQAPTYADHGGSPVPWLYTYPTYYPSQTFNAAVTNRAIQDIRNELGDLKSALALRDREVEECQKRVEDAEKEAKEYKIRLEAMEKELLELKATHSHSLSETTYETEDGFTPQQQKIEPSIARVPLEYINAYYKDLFPSSESSSEDFNPVSVVSQPLQTSGDIILFGGLAHRNNICKSVESWDDRSGMWTQVASLPKSMDPVHISAVGYDSDVAFLLSSFPSQQKRNPIFRYLNGQEETNSWTDMNASDLGRFLASSTKLEDSICVAGGYTCDQPILWSTSPFPFPPDMARINITDKVELFNPCRESWTPLTPLPQPLVRNVLLQHSNHVIYSIGGAQLNSGNILQPTNHVNRFDAREGVWTSVREMLSPRAFFDAVFVQDHYLMAIGGIDAAISSIARVDASSTNSVEMFDIRNNQWSRMESMKHPRCFHTVQILNNDDIYIIGGQSQLVRPQANAQVVGMDVFSFLSKRWKEFGMLAGVQTKRYAHASCVL